MELRDFAEQTLEEFKTRLYRALDGLTFEEINWRPTQETNSIAFIVWHVARVEDRWIQRFAQDAVEVWVKGDWYKRLGLPEGDTGVRYSADQLGSFPQLASEDLRGYFDDVREETLKYLRGLGAGDLDVAPARAPFPEVSPVPRAFEGFTINRMIRQLIGEENQHLGQVAYVRGLQRGLGK